LLEDEDTSVVELDRWFEDDETREELDLTLKETTDELALRLEVETRDGELAFEKDRSDEELDLIEDKELVTEDVVFKEETDDVEDRRLLEETEDVAFEDDCGLVDTRDGEVDFVDVSAVEILVDKTTGRADVEDDEGILDVNVALTEFEEEIGGVEETDLAEERVEFVEEAVIFELTAAPYEYTLSRSEPPQISDELPLHAIVQPEVARVPPLEMAFPQSGNVSGMPCGQEGCWDLQHSPAYSMPARV